MFMRVLSDRDDDARGYANERDREYENARDLSGVVSSNSIHPPITMIDIPEIAPNTCVTFCGTTYWNKNKRRKPQ